MLKRVGESLTKPKVFYSVLIGALCLCLLSSLLQLFVLWVLLQLAPYAPR